MYRCSHILSLIGSNSVDLLFSNEPEILDFKFEDDATLSL